MPRNTPKFGGTPIAVVSANRNSWFTFFEEGSLLPVGADPDDPAARFRLCSISESDELSPAAH